MILIYYWQNNSPKFLDSPKKFDKNNKEGICIHIYLYKSGGVESKNGCEGRK